MLVEIFDDECQWPHKCIASDGPGLYYVSTYCVHEHYLI